MRGIFGIVGLGGSTAGRWARRTVTDFTSREMLALYTWLVLNFAMSLAIAILLVVMTRKVVGHHYQSFPFVGDTFSYFSRRLGEAMILAEHGRKAALALAAENQRNPLNSLTLALYPSRLAGTLSGFAFFNAACYAAFSFMLSHVVWRRTGLWGFALAAALLTASIRMFFDPTYGFASELPDLPAALLTGCAVLALLASDRGDRPVWIIWFAAFAGLATLSRISASMYIFVICAPLLAAYSLRILLRHGPFRLALVGGISGAVLFLVAGRFLYEHLLPTLTFYKVAGYALNSDVATSYATTVVPFFTLVIGLKYWAILVPAVVWIAQIRWKDIDWWSTLETAWVILAVPVLLIFVLKQRDDYTQMYFAIPGFVLLACAPFALVDSARWRYLARPSLSLILPVTALAAYGAIAVDNYRDVLSRHPTASLSQERAYHRQMAEILVASDNWAKDQLNQELSNFDAAYDYYWRYIVPAVQFDFKKQIPWRPTFQIRASQWELVYGTLPLDQQRRSFMNDISMNVNAMAVLTDPTAPEALVALKDKTTIDWAIAVRDYVSVPDNGWIKLGEATGPVGHSVVYVNHIKRIHDSVRFETALALREALRGAVAERRVDNGRPIVRVALDLPRSRGPESLLPDNDVRREVYSMIPLVSAVSTRLSIADSARLVVQQLNSGDAMIALPVDPGASDLRRYLLNDINAQIIQAVADIMDADAEHWALWGTVQTQAGAFKLYLNRRIFRDR